MSEVPYGYCHCGCGQKTNLAKQANSKLMVKKGEPYRYINGHAGKNTEVSFWAKVDKSGDCWIWKGAPNAKGYGVISFQGKNNWLAHRLSYHLTYGPIPNGMEVCHKCDNPLCVNPDHLFLGTHKENMEDMARKGRAVNGEENHKHKLKKEDVITIRESYKNGVPGPELAQRYGVYHSSIYKIIHHKNWRHI